MLITSDEKFHNVSSEKFYSCRMDPSFIVCDARVSFLKKKINIQCSSEFLKLEPKNSGAGSTKQSSNKPEIKRGPRKIKRSNETHCVFTCTLMMCMIRVDDARNILEEKKVRVARPSEVADQVPYKRR